MLVIVESPNKIKAIKTYLGDEYEVLATKGHFRDLPRKHLGNIPEKWETIRGRGSIVSVLRKASKRHPDGVILATDPDREGEGIAWHVCDVLGLDPASTPRAIFHEVTKDAVCIAVQDALRKGGPRLDLGLVGAQKARRLIDRRIGYSGTRYLWKMIGGGVSAGRCLIPATVLLRDVNRDEDSAGTRYVVKGELCTKYSSFHLRDIIDTDTCELQSYLPGITFRSQEIEGGLAVKSITRTKTRREPPRPLDTASAMTAIGMSPSSAMRVLQSLFEKGLITYHRTTSRVVSDTFVNMVGQKNPVPVTDITSNVSTTNSAHEAIRPAGKTSIQHPDALPDTLDDTERRAYGIIWNHAVGSLYPVWVGETLQVTLAGGWTHSWVRSTTSTINWMSVTGCDPDPTFPTEIDSLRQGDTVDVLNGWVRCVQENAGRGVSESGMVRLLQTTGIGRPSTYATIVSNLTKRGLAGFLPRPTRVVKEFLFGESASCPSVPTKNPCSFRVTKVGEACIQALYESDYAPFFQIEYTSRLETILDSIADGTYLGEWTGFVDDIDRTIGSISTEHQVVSVPASTSSTKRGSFPEETLGKKGVWIYGKGRTRYGPVVWRHKNGQTRREYKKVSANQWHRITHDDAIRLLHK